MEQPLFRLCHRTAVIWQRGDGVLSSVLRGKSRPIAGRTRNRPTTEETNITELPRLRPDPIPAIHPLPEYLADGWVKKRYEDMKAVFQVPWMGVVTMAYAHYPTFYDAFWTGLRPLCASRPFVEAFQDLRTYVE